MADSAPSVARRTVVVAVASALLGAGATALVLTHPFTDEGRLLSSPFGAGHRVGPPIVDGRVLPGWARHRDTNEDDGQNGQDQRHEDDRSDGWKHGGLPLGWSHGDKSGWKGGSTPPGWAHHKDKRLDRHDRSTDEHHHDR